MSEESDQEEGAYARGALVFKDNRTNLRGDTCLLRSRRDLCHYLHCETWRRSRGSCAGGLSG